ncbi:hypothetical protein V8E51_000428 [Hyaloscypha variabilis]|jgi:hypothetical protein
MASKTDQKDKEKRAKRPDRPNWNSTETNFLIENAKLMERFGGKLNDEKFARYMNDHIGPGNGKPLLRRRGKKNGEDEFTERMVKDTVGRVRREDKEAKRKSRLPEIAKAGSKCDYEGPSSVGTEAMRIKGPVSEDKIAPKISDSGMDGATLDIAVSGMSGPSREKDHKGLGKQGEKRYEPGPSELSKSCATSGAGRGGGPGINSQAREDNMLSMRGPGHSNTSAGQQTHIPPNPPQANAPLQTGYSAPHNLHHGSLSHGREHEQHHIPTRQAESESSIPAPVHDVLQPQLQELPPYVQQVSWLSNDLAPLRLPPTLPALPIHSPHALHPLASEPGPKLAPINQPKNACDGNCEPGACKGHGRKNR